MAETEQSAADTQQVAGETANERILHALRESEQRFRALVSAGAYTIYRMSPDWRQMYEVEGEDFERTETPIEDWPETYILDEDRPFVLNAIDEAIRTKSLLELEHRVRLPDGSIAWVLSRAVPLFGPDGEIVEWFGAGTDISARKRFEQALRESEGKYRALFDTMGQGFCELELIRDSDGKAVDELYLELNPAFGRLFGIAVAEARGRRASEVMPALQPDWHEAFDRVARSGVPERIEYQVQSLGRWFEVFAYPQGGDRLTVLYDDVTSRKLGEQALRDSEERQRFLLNFSDALRAEPDADAVASCAIRLFSQQIQIDRCYIASYRIEDGVADITHQAGNGRVPPLPDMVQLSDFPAAVRVAFEGTLVIDDDFERKGLSQAEVRNSRRLGMRAMIASTVRKGLDQPLWSMVAVSARRRRWTPGEIALAEEVAERTWAAIERARAEAAVRQSERRLEAMFQALPIGIGLVDRKGKIILCNQQMQKYLPTNILPSQDTARISRWQVCNADGKPAEPKDWPGARALRGEHVVPGVEMSYTDETGATIWTSMSAVPVRDGRGKITGHVAAILDITEQTRAEQALRQSEERFREFGEASSDLLWIRNAQTLAFEYLSPAFERLYGVPREQFLENNTVEAWLRLIHPDDRKRMLGAMKLLRAGIPSKHEFRIIRSSGAICWIQNTDFPMVDQKGQVHRIAGIAQDVTGRKRAVEMQATLLAELQHRVRNVLAMVRSVVRRTSANKDEVEDFVEHLEGRVDAMARTQALLTRSPGKGVEMENLVRDEMIAQCADDDKYTAHGPPVQLSPLAAEVLTLAIHELATNSVKYGALGQSEGGVTVAWECSGTGEERRLTLTWRETGLQGGGAGAPGFGTELITERVPYELKGEGSLDVRDGTLTATIAFPLEAGSSILDTATAPSVGVQV